MQTAELPVVESINDGGRPEKNLPRCESELSEMGKRYRDSSGRDHRCERRARYRVGGACLCRTHAGECLIDLLLDRRVESRPRLTPTRITEILRGSTLYSGGVLHELESGTLFISAYIDPRRIYEQIKREADT